MAARERDSKRHQPLDLLLDKMPHLSDLIRLFKGSAVHYMIIGIALNVRVNELLQNSMSAFDNLMLVFMGWIDDYFDVTWRKVLQVCKDYPEELGQANVNIESFLSSDRAHNKYLKGTDTSTELDEFDRESKKLQLSDLLRLFKGSAVHYMIIGIALDVRVNDLMMSASDSLMLVFQRWIDSDIDVTWRNILQVCKDYPKELGQANADMESFLSSDRARSAYLIDGTDTTGITSTEADEFDRENLLLDKKPQLKDLYKLFICSAVHYMIIGSALNVQMDELLQNPVSAFDRLTLVFQRWMDSNIDVTWRKVLQVCEDYPEELGQANVNIESFLSFDRARNKYLNGTDTTGITGTEADEFNREKIEKWLEEGEVELQVTRINMHGAPGAGKTCTQHLLLNEPPPVPPEKLTDSTPIACRAVQATRISIDDKNKKWQRVDIKDLLNQLASTEVDKPPKPEYDVPAHSDELTKNEPTRNEPINPTENIRTENKPIENKQAENKATEKKSTEKKPAKNKPTNTELVKKMLKAFKEGKSKKLSTNWVYFIDSGGQPAYRELLPLFTRAAALNIITIDLTKGLDEKFEFQYRISQNTIPIKTKLEYSNRDIIRSTISSEAMLSPVKFPYVSNSETSKHSHYLILGTRNDKSVVTEEKLKEMNESLGKYLANTKFIPHNRNGSIIFPINTLLKAGSKEREEASVALCTKISLFSVAITIKLPIRLFTFEIALQMEAEKKKHSFLTKKEVIKIGNSLQLDKEADINDALQYLHNVTIILYYRDVDDLKDLIFVDPEPILNVLSRLIAITYVDDANLFLIADPPPSIDERNNLIDFGLFKEDILTIIGKQVFNGDFQPFHMISLLMHLHIIAKIENRKEGDYFFPCALPSFDKLNDPPTEIQPLLIAWEIDNSGTRTLAIPQGLFPLTIVHLLEQKDKVGFCPVGKEYYRHHDAMSLRVNEEYTIDIINRCTHIEIRFYDCKDFCPQIRELVKEAIKRSIKDLNVDGNHIFAFKCSMDEQCYCIVKEDKSSTKCTQCRLHCKVLQGDDDSYKCWFSDCQSSSPDTVQVSTPSAQRDGPAEQDSTIECSNFLSRNLGCCMFMIFLAVLASVTINYFVVGKNANDVEKILTIMTHIATGALPAQPHHGSTTVNPYIDGAVQLSIEDANMVLTVLNKALFAPTKWDDLGLELGLLMPRLNVIGEGGGDAYKHLKKTIEAWLMGADNAKSRTWQTLIDAVREAGDRAAADRIPEKLKSLYDITL